MDDDEFTDSHTQAWNGLSQKHAEEDAEKGKCRSIEQTIKEAKS